MNFLRNNRTVIGAAVLGVLLIAGYFLFGGSSGGSSLLSSSPAPSNESQQLLATLGDLHSVSLDNTIFKNQIFMSLMDFGTVIPTQPVGRHNPFAAAGATPAPQTKAPANAQSQSKAPTNAQKP